MNKSHVSAIIFTRACCAVLLAAFLVSSSMPASAARHSLQQDRRRPDDQEPLKLNATLVQVPAVATDRAGKLVTDIAKTEFTIFEDGKRQEVSTFAAIKQPFSAALVLDTSNSAEDRLSAIQNTAASFAREMRQDDRMMVIAFDNEVRQLTDFTSNVEEVEAAIKGTQSGYGKLLYEAVERALEQLKNVEGRRAVVLFSDGVDMRSIEASAESTVRMAEEAGAVIYVVRFDTRWWIEAAARRQKSEQKESKVPFSIDGRIPLPPEYGGPDASPPEFPRVRAPRIEIGGGPTSPPVTVINGDTRTRHVPQAMPDEITRTLDKMYGEAESYMQSLASRTGGQVFAAESFEHTRSAFAAIAEELRNLYLIGYYSSNDRRDGKYHKIKVEVARKEIRVRARPGYRSPKE